ncbi:hypothetical protein OIO90_004731 [Microbotryomycetes sp. JL221]|nr:hypothetical protein OIO90_004731 [Microbotryomycetes sp. JL221]
MTNDGSAFAPSTSHQAAAAAKSGTESAKSGANTTPSGSSSPAKDVKITQDDQTPTQTKAQTSQPVETSEKKSTDHAKPTEVKFNNHKDINESGDKLGNESDLHSKEKAGDREDPETFEGEATFYFAKGANCGRKIEIVRVGSDKKATVEVADLCPSCAQTGSVDLSEAAFLKLGKKDEGLFPIKWHFVS